MTNTDVVVFASRPEGGAGSQVAYVSQGLVSNASMAEQCQEIEDSFLGLAEKRRDIFKQKMALKNQRSLSKAATPDKKPIASAFPKPVADLVKTLDLTNDTKRQIEISWHLNAPHQDGRTMKQDVMVLADRMENPEDAHTVLLEMLKCMRLHD